MEISAPIVRGEELDHVVGERLGRGHHLALLQQEPHHVGRGPVQAGTEVLGVEPRSTTVTPSGTGAVAGV